MNIATDRRQTATGSVSSLAVTVVGSLNIDITAYAERLPTAGETVGSARLERSAGGKGANQAAAAARLGAKVHMLGAVGPDPEGDFLLHSLESAGVDTSLVSRSHLPTGTALIVVDRSGENHIVVCPGANGSLLPDGLPHPATDLVLAQLEVPIEVVIDAATRSPGYFSLNASPARQLPVDLIAACDLIVVNEHEYSQMPELKGAPLVAVTYGAAGAALVEHGREAIRVPGVKAPVVNTVGAGDAFGAALPIALTLGLPPEVALAAACRVGAAAVADAASQPALKDLGTYL
ncbi:ribokinase [Microbacterium sp. AK009]|uniref:PfkB family carbohydrate kinase n=1 Tax=Microbacterium sp. AK009 TaxID=2723068 RepID=UPI00183965C0|nr:PfkB family carbohydrate kinase [Microbacterium sp. AK009]NYF16609.1 ribokinase [Microbacterium sp. AK009]